jgi:hypothetical protein
MTKKETPEEKAERVYGEFKSNLKGLNAFNSHRNWAANGDLGDKVNGSYSALRKASHESLKPYFQQDPNAFGLRSYARPEDIPEDDLEAYIQTADQKMRQTSAEQFRDNIIDIAKGLPNNGLEQLLGNKTIAARVGKDEQKVISAYEAYKKAEFGYKVYSQTGQFVEGLDAETLIGQAIDQGGKETRKRAKDQGAHIRLQNLAEVIGKRKVQRDRDYQKAMISAVLKDRMESEKAKYDKLGVSVYDVARKALVLSTLGAEDPQQYNEVMQTAYQAANVK